MSGSSGARNVGVIIVAGGTGSRVAATASGEGQTELKQFRWIAGKPMLLHSLQTFMARPDVCAVVCVLPRHLVADPPPWIFQCDIDRLMLSIGGRTRQESVANGLEDLSDDAEIVLVHDAARPFVDELTIDRVVQGVREAENHAVVAALPTVDTLKEVDQSGAVLRTIDRSTVWRAQTPQGFRRETIVRLHRQAKAERFDGTDDVSLAEHFRVPVKVVRGSERAMKITEEADFARGTAWFPLPE